MTSPTAREVDILAYIVKTHVGIKAYGSIFGVIFAAFTLGVLAGPILMGAAFDVFGTNLPMLLAFSVMAMVSAPSSPGLAMGNHALQGVGSTCRPTHPVEAQRPDLQARRH